MPRETEEQRAIRQRELAKINALLGRAKPQTPPAPQPGTPEFREQQHQLIAKMVVPKAEVVSITGPEFERAKQRAAVRRARTARAKARKEAEP